MVIGKMENGTLNSKFRKCAAAAAAALVLLSAGATVAFFTDQDEKLNTFTVGNIDIQLDEPEWDPENGKNITPDKEVNKDPQITNTGVNDAYVFMEVSIPRSSVSTADADGGVNAAAVQDLFTFKANEGWTLMNKKSNTSSTTYYYAYTNADNTMKALSPLGVTAPVFDSVRFINMVEGELSSNNLSINVIARGIQTDGLNTTDPEEVYALVMGGASE